MTTTQSSGPSEARISFAGIRALAARWARQRGRISIVFVWLGLLLAVVPGLFAGDAFLRTGIVYFKTLVATPGVAAPVAATPVAPTPVMDAQVIYDLRLRKRRRTTLAVGSRPRSMFDLVKQEPGWAAALTSIALIPLLFWRWRRTGMAFGRALGVLWAGAAGVSVWLLTHGTPQVPPGWDRVVGGWYWTVIAGSALLAAGFLISPEPRDAS